MKKRKTSITSFQLFTLMANTMIGTGFFTIARSVGEKAGRGLVIAIPLAGLLAFLQLFGMYLLARRFPNQTIAEYIHVIVGRVPGKIYLLGYGLISLALAMTVLRNFWLLASAWLYPLTPSLVYFSIMIVLCWNIAKRGLVVVGRMSEIILYLTLPIMVVMLIPPGRVNVDYLRPVFDRSISDVLRGVFPAYFSLTGFEFFLIAFPFVQKKRAWPTAMASLTTVTIFYALTAALTVAILGFETTMISVWPLQQYVSRIEVLLLERIDIIILLFWVLQIIMTATVWITGATVCLRGVVPKLSSSGAAHVVALVLIALALYPLNLPDQSQIQDVVSYAAFVWLGILPFLIWVIALVRSAGGEKHAEEGVM